MDIPKAGAREAVPDIAFRPAAQARDDRADLYGSENTEGAVYASDASEAEEEKNWTRQEPIRPARPA